MTKKKPCEQGFPLENQLVMLQNSGVEELIGEKLFICEDPEIVGATGAALLALETLGE